MRQCRAFQPMREGQMTCPRCGTQNPTRARFCLECATPLALASCPRCSAAIPAAARFCPQCGSSLQATSEGPAGDPSGGPSASRALQAERRQLTVMFCDLVGSTALSGRLDPEELRDVVRSYQAACAQVVHRFDGHIAQYLGDGLLIYFGYPAAHEDDAQRAVGAGLGIVEAMKPLGLSVRVGIHTGPVVVGEIGDDSRR